MEVRPRHYRPGDKDAPRIATVAHTDTRRSGGGIGRHSFFKQKTAYEISECDWSSDVCSSD
eukprot:COSAG01_NODE_67829_length_266_cov_0.401198_1_plen_60_part_10